MTQNPSIDPSPFLLEGGPVGVLLVHGFTGAPPEVRLVGHYLHQRGFTVSGPLLPGHGTQLEDMNQCRWADWTGHVAEALADLQDRCETVFVGGLSMGALLTLYLAAYHSELTGAILYSPAIIISNRLSFLIPIAKYLVRQISKSEGDSRSPQVQSRVWSYDAYPVPAVHELLKLTSQVKRLLSQVTLPLLIIHSTGDQTIHPDSAQFVHDRVGSTDKELLILHDSEHVVTLDGEWERVAGKTYQFILDHLPE